MIIRNKVWKSITEADANRICARRYANIQRRIIFGYKVAIPLLSGLSAVAIRYGETDAAFWTLVILCLSTIIKAVFPQLVLPDGDITALDNLHTIFTNDRDKAENLLWKIDNKKIPEEEALSELESLQKVITKHTSELNKLVLWIPRFVDNSITKESDRYLNATHNNKYE